MRAKLAFLSLILLSSQGITSAQGRDDPNPTAVVQLVQSYLEGWTKADLAMIRRAFHPKAKIFLQTANDLRQVEVSNGFRSFKQTTGQDMPLSAAMSVVSIDVTGDVGFAKIQMVYGATPRDLRIVEYLTLMRFSDGWRIISKLRSVEEVGGIRNKTTQSLTRLKLAPRVRSEVVKIERLRGNFL